MTQVRTGDVKELVLTDGVTRTQLVQYAGASGDYNPLHSDERFATEVAGFPSLFAHGMLTMGMTGRVITDWFGPEAVLTFGGRFVGQVWPGDRLTATATVTGVRDDGTADVAISTTNQAGEVVLSATATVRTG
jgi:acyl dehydratase